MLVTLRGLRVNPGLALIGVWRTGSRFCVLLCSLWLCEISINQFNFFSFFQIKVSMWLMSGFLNSQVTRLLLVRKQVPAPLSLTLVLLPVLGLVVWRLISNNPRLNVNWGFFIPNIQKHFPILFRTSSHQIVDKQNCLEFPFKAFRSEIRFHTDPGLSWPSFKQPSLDQHILQTSLLALKLLGVTKREFLLTIPIQYQANKWWE